MVAGRLSDYIKLDVAFDGGGAYDGGAANLIDMRDFDGCLVIVHNCSAIPADGSNVVTGFNIISNSASDGSGTDTVIAEAVTTEGGTTAALVAADMGATTTPGAAPVDTALLQLDIKADMMADGDRYIAAVLIASGTLPVLIEYIRYRAAHAFKDMLVTTRAAFQFDGDT